ncbi:MAG: hypothetical protein LC768_06670 [Acidobacteria bacterium]|nr:hypothetical protein [Acidobacteriota bacterium]
MSSFVALAFLLLLSFPASAQKSKQCKAQRFMFERGKSSIILRGQLEPCENRIYKFRARQRQKMSLRLYPEENDVVVYAQSTKYIPELGSNVLEGISRGGTTEWDGELPFSGEYELYITHPPVSNSTQQRTLPYKLEVKIE